MFNKKIGLCDLSDKNIIVTGASSGIGRAISIACSRYGANVIGFGRNEQELRKTFESMDQGNHKMLSIDLTCYEKIEFLVNEIKDEIGSISGFVHAAGIDCTIPLKNMNIKKYEEMFSINVFAGFELARIISKKKYISRNGAKFIFISSVMGSFGKPGRIGYSATKGALISGVRSMALELQKKKINVNCISPAMIQTEMWENLKLSLTEESINEILSFHPGGIGKVEDVANAATFLLSDMSNFITGIDLKVDGGYSSL